MRISDWSSDVCSSDLSITLPALLTIDPLGGFTGVPIDVAGQSSDGRWLSDLSASLPAGGILEAGQSTTGRTVSIATGGNQRLSLVVGVVAGTLPNTAPAFTSQPPETAETGTELRYRVTAEDAEGQAIFYGLLTAPEGMEIDSETGLLTWTPGPDASALTTVVVAALDTRGAISLQRFVLAVRSEE